MTTGEYLANPNSFRYRSRMSSYVAIDFEIANRAMISACAVGLVRVEGGRTVARERFLIQPPTRAFTFTHIHGLSWGDVAQAPTFPEVLPAMAEFWAGADFLAAHNAGFDRGVLRACCEAWTMTFPDQDWVCTVQLARRVWDLRPTGLAHCARFLCVPLDHHEALSDANACAEIVKAAMVDGWSYVPETAPPA